MPNLIGTAPDQVPVNGFLGNMAFQNKEGVVTDLLSTTALTVTGTASFVGAIATSLGSAAAPSYTFIGDTNTGMFSPGADTIAFSEGGAEVMRITSAGNLGIGTSSPAYKLDVNGTSYFSDNMVLSRANTAGSISGITITNAGTSASYAGLNINSGTVSSQFFNDAAGNAVVAGAVLRTTSNHPLVIGTNNTERMRIDASGNVGINQPPNASQGRVQISQPLGSSADGALRLTDNATTSFIFNNISSGLSALWSSGAVALGTGSSTFTERMRIDSSGNVGIGVTPASWYIGGATRALQIGANTAVFSLFGTRSVFSSNYYLRSPGGEDTYIATGAATQYYQESGQHVWLNAASGTAGTNISFSERMRINASGNVGIGTASPNASAILDVQSTTKGFRLPNMTTTQKNAISSPAAGLMVFDTTLAKSCIYSGSAWETITSL